MFSYQEFISFPVTPKQFATVFGAIPNGVIMLFKGYNSVLRSSEMPLPDTVDRYVGGICFKSTLKNYFIFLNDCVSTHVSKWNRSVENILWKKVWALPNKYLLANKVKEISLSLFISTILLKPLLLSNSI